MKEAETQQEETQEETITIDPKELREGTCHIRKWGGRKVSVCKDHGKIKIFEVEKEE